MNPRVVFYAYSLLQVAALVAAFGAGSGALHPALAVVCIAPAAIPWVGAYMVLFMLGSEDRRAVMAMTVDECDRDD